MNALTLDAPAAPAPAAGFAPCPFHPGKTASSSCERCGTFHCGACLNLDNLCAACVERAVAELPKLQTRSLVARLTMAGLGVSYVLMALSRLIEGKGGELARGLIGLLLIPCFVVGVPAFLMWFHLAARRAQALGANIQGTPGYAVGSFFIPFIGLVHPYRVARALLTTAGQPTGVVTVWQVGWLFGGIITPLIVMSKSVGGEAIANVLSAISLAACVLVITRVGALDRSETAAE
jgi:hypothetical protein